MSNAHGIIFAYSASPELGSLVTDRTASSVPVGSKYRLIDFSLSSMMNAGIRDVGVIMQRDYQSLLDHLGSGKVWDMSLKTGGLRLLPPFGLPEYHRGKYTGTVEALNAVSTYIEDIKSKYIVLFLGNLLANVDIQAALEQHERSGAGITAICTDREISDLHYRYITDEGGAVKKLLFSGDGEGCGALECYIATKSVLVEILKRAKAANQYSFHKGALADYLADGGTMSVYVHKGYACFCRTVDSYFEASMDMLKPEVMADLTTQERPVRTKSYEVASTYYGESSAVKNSLVADGCIIEGKVENSIIFSDVRIKKGAVLKNCIVMRGSVVGEGAELDNVISDKAVVIGAGLKLVGSAGLPVVVPKGKRI